MGKMPKRSKRFMPVCAASSKGIHEMLNAFEDKLEEVGGSTQVQAAYDPEYKDVGGGFGEPGAVYKYSEIKQYWDEDHDSDPVLQEYDSFEDWWNDTRENYLQEVEGCGSVQAATIEDMLGAFETRLDELGASTDIRGSEAVMCGDIDDQIWDIAQRYTTSSPVSGDWDTEPAHLLKAIIEETGLSEGEAKSKMIEVLGWEPREVYQLSPLEASTSIQAGDNSDDLGEDYVNNLMNEVTKDIRSSGKTKYELDPSGKNILLTTVNKDGIIVEYTIPLLDLQGKLEVDLDLILEAIKSL